MDFKNFENENTAMTVDCSNPRLCANAIVLFNDTKRALDDLFDLTDSSLYVSVSEVVLRITSFVRKMINAGCNSISEYIDKLLLTDFNEFSRKASRGEQIPATLKNIVCHDLAIFRELCHVNVSDFIYYDDYCDVIVEWKNGFLKSTYESLLNYYSTNGCGVYSLSNAFICDLSKDKEGREGFCIRPVTRCNAKLSDLKGYDEEKEEVLKNTKNFIDGKPAFNTLLYGDRGTGKSTTVQALSNEFNGKLKVVQLYKSGLTFMPKLIEDLDETGLKWIIFIDDLVFDEGDDSYNFLKATLEGSLYSSQNVLVYATTNRRHLLKEGEVQSSDDIQEQMALFDRFGLVVTYIAPQKDDFISILKDILLSRNVKWKKEYEHIAELAVLRKGGRTPRVAKQIADVIQASLKERK